jgi:hypothetical protein
MDQGPFNIEKIDLSYNNIPLEYIDDFCLVI